MSVSDARDAEIFEHIFPLNKDVSNPYVVPSVPVESYDTNRPASCSTPNLQADEPRMMFGSDCVIICLYVDHMLILGNTLDVINKNKELLSSNFDMKDLGEAGVILGVRVIRNFEGIFLSQSHYVEMVLKKFNSFDVALARTPYNPSLHLTKDLDESISQNEYAKIIGNVMILMNCTRHDIAYAISRLSRYTHNPSGSH
ncbi:hypothetical protein LIER_35876 [Lithospermum erythrorhizon]|uniref:Reverse transcriptase Ty1/copia-type domain-containing protein n=1 Tax=Lithospermum erythrorhizon TaxID=34254 RepID=A0AAV3NYV6_LITER